MHTPRRLLLPAAALLLLVSACSSSDDPAAAASTMTRPPLGTLPPPGTLPPLGTLPPPVVPTSDPTQPSLPPSTLPPGAEPKPGVEHFVPRLPLADGVLSLDVVYVDGTRSLIEWPATLDLVSQGLIPYGWAFISGGSSRDFFVRPGTVDAVIERLGGAELLEEFTDGTGGMVGLWRPQNDEVDYLGFQFGNWMVLVFDYRNDLAMSAEHRALWATNFHGEVTDGGFLVLSADSPLFLVFAGDYPTPLNMTMRGASGEVKLTPGECVPGVIDGIDGNAFTIWCNEAATMTVTAYGSREFQEAVRKGLIVDSVEIAIPPEPPEPEADGE